MFQLHQEAQTKTWPYIVSRTQDVVNKELGKVTWLIALGSCLFVVHTILRIYLVVPLQLHRSSCLTRVKRSLFEMTQFKCKLRIFYSIALYQITLPSP